jgi:hypothetical protein
VTNIISPPAPIVIDDDLPYLETEDLPNLEKEKSSTEVTPAVKSEPNPVLKTLDSDEPEINETSNTVLIDQEPETEFIEKDEKIHDKDQIVKKENLVPVETTPRVKIGQKRYKFMTKLPWIGFFLGYSTFCPRI